MGSLSHLLLLFFIVFIGVALENGGDARPGSRRALGGQVAGAPKRGALNVFLGVHAIAIAIFLVIVRHVLVTIVSSALLCGNLLSDPRVVLLEHVDMDKVFDWVLADIER